MQSTKNYTINDLLKISIDNSLEMLKDGEELTPCLIFVTSTGLTHNILDGDGVETCLSMASNIIERQTETPSLYSITYDGRITIEGEKTDSLLIELGGCDQETAYLVAQRYKPGSPVEKIGGALKIQETSNRLLASKKIGPFTLIEWNKLTEIPVVLFLLIAEADGEIDKKELSQMSKFLNSTNDSFPEGIRALISSTANNYSEILPDVQSFMYDRWEALESASQIFSKCLDASEAIEFKKSLYDFSESIAASSGGFLGFGSKIGKAERDTLNRIRTIFSL